MGVDKLTLRNFEGQLVEYVESKGARLLLPYEEVCFQSPAADVVGLPTSRGNPAESLQRVYPARKRQPFQSGRRSLCCRRERT